MTSSPSESDEAASFIDAIAAYYDAQWDNIIQTAAKGWFFAVSFEKALFRDAQAPARGNLSRRSPPENAPGQLPPDDHERVGTVSGILDDLKNEPDLVKRYERLKALSKGHHPHLTQDSFHPAPHATLEEAQDQTFLPGALNIAIIGAGVAGLFLANGLKNRFGEKINILMLDNRSPAPGLRDPIDRYWLTHISAGAAGKHLHGDIKPLLACFGTEGLIGIPINLFETLLMLSCKQQGVTFHFSPEIDYAHLNNAQISCVFDATGGRLPETFVTYEPAKAFNVAYPKNRIDPASTGIRQLENFPDPEDPVVRFAMQPSETVVRPFAGETQIVTDMVKLLRIPAHLLPDIRAYIQDDNADNRFFVWEGKLQPPLNEGLAFINLTAEEAGLLSEHLSTSLPLGHLFRDHEDALAGLDKPIVAFLDFLAKLDQEQAIEIDPPFAYTPHLAAPGMPRALNGKPVFLVGDSLFCGHPKLGNGLAAHLVFINGLADVLPDQFSR